MNTIDLERLEGDVRHVLSRTNNDPAMKAADLGRLSAEAVQAQYENAAREVEEMGNAIKDRIQKLEAALRECDADMKYVAEAAIAIREKGKHVHLQIQEASTLSQEIRAAASEFTKKVTNGS